MDRIGVGTLCLVALPISVLLYFRFAAPEQLYERFVPFEDYPTEPMQEAMRVDRVDREHRTILAFGSRFAGQPGYYRSADYIRDAFEQAGLEIYEQEFQTVAPQTALPGDIPGARRERRPSAPRGAARGRLDLPLHAKFPPTGGHAPGGNHWRARSP